MDLLSLACIHSFYITCGRHSFGNYDNRDKNIKNKDHKSDLSSIEDFPKAFDHIPSLIKFNLRKDEIII